MNIIKKIYFFSTVILLNFFLYSCHNDNIEEERLSNQEPVLVVRNDKPSFISGQNNIENTKKWVKVNNLSDEFNEPKLNEALWQNTNSKRWIGRAPGLFKKNTVSQSNGNLKLTCYQLETTEVIKGNLYTHAGSNLYSKHHAQVGQYFECRMKANKTFMSSTFWLINSRNEFNNCDKRVTELDIQECVGQVTGDYDFSKNFDQGIHSHIHSREASCGTTPIGSHGDKTLLNRKVSEGYHIYGAWWKSPTEIEFYLDGKKVYTITPIADFDLQMQLRLVVETYDWNPAPKDGGMTGSKEDRTTYYDWVRTWELKDI